MEQSFCIRVTKEEIDQKFKEKKSAQAVLKAFIADDILVDNAGSNSSTWEIRQVKVKAGEYFQMPRDTNLAEFLAKFL